MANTNLTIDEAARAKIGWALGQTAYSLNNGGGLTVGRPLTYIDDFSNRVTDANGQVTNAWQPLNVDIPSGFIVKGIYQDPTTGADAFMAYNYATNEVVIGVAGTNGVGHDMPDTHSDFVKVGADQVDYLMKNSSLVNDLEALKQENISLGGNGDFSRVIMGGQSLAGGVARSLGYLLSTGDSPIFDPQNLTVSVQNPLGVEVSASILKINFSEMQAWGNVAEVLNFVDYNQQGTSDIVSTIGGRGVGRYFALDVSSEDNSSFGGLHPFNFGLAEGLNAIGGDLTQARAIDEPPPLTHSSITQLSSSINDLFGVDNNWVSIGTAGFASLLLSRPGETTQSVATFLENRFGLNSVLSEAIGFTVEAVTRIVSYQNPITAVYSILSAFGIGKAIGSANPAVPNLLPVDQGYTRSVFNNGNVYIAVDTSDHDTILRYADGSSWKVNGDLGGSEITRPDGTRVLINSSMQGVVVSADNQVLLIIGPRDQIDVKPGGALEITSPAEDGVNATIREVYRDPSTNTLQVKTLVGVFVANENAPNGQEFRPNQISTADVTSDFVAVSTDSSADVTADGITNYIGVQTYNGKNYLVTDDGVYHGTLTNGYEEQLQFTDDGSVTKIFDRNNILISTSTVSTTDITNGTVTLQITEYPDGHTTSQTTTITTTDSETGPVTVTSVEFSDGHATSETTNADGLVLQRSETQVIGNNSFTVVYDTLDHVIKTERVVITVNGSVETTQTTTMVPSIGTTIVTSSTDGTFDVKGYDSFNTLVSTSHTNRTTTSDGALADQTVDKQYDVSTGRVVNTVTSFHPLLDTQTSVNVTGDFAGGTISVNYTLDENQQIVGAHVVSINGSAPLNGGELDTFFEDNDINPSVITANGDFGPGTDPGAYAQYLALKQFVLDHADPSATKPLPPPSNAIQTFTNALQTTQDVLQFIQAIQSGQPLPVVASGLRLATQIDTDLHGSAISTNLAGASDIASGVLSVLSFSNALKNGDALGAVTSGAQAVNYSASAYLHLVDSNSAFAGSVKTLLSGNGASIIGTDGSLQLENAGVLAYLNIVSDLTHGDYAGAAIDTIAIVNPELAPLAIAYHVFSFIFDLFGGDDIPDAWGNGQYRWNGSSNSVTYQAAGENTGQEAVSGVMQQTLSYLNQVIAQQNTANPSNPLGIIPNRMPNISYGYDLGGYRFSDIDPLTGVDSHPGLTYDTNGRPFNATPGSPESFESIGEAIIRSAINRGAIAPKWEVDTAYLQTQNHTPYAGLSEEERAARTGNIATPISATATTQTARIIGLDMDSTVGVQTISKDASDAALNIDNSGYLKHTSWIAPTDAILTLDRNANGVIDGGKELFNNTAIDISQRGIKSLAWADSNNDGIIDNRDPVYNQLKVWRDTNGNGTIDSGENTSIAYNGISQLNYKLGTYTITTNGVTQTKQMASVDLTADTAGSIAIPVSNGILIQNSNGNTSLIATVIQDASGGSSDANANKDLVNGIENVELIVSMADLVKNDTYINAFGETTPVIDPNNTSGVPDYALDPTTPLDQFNNGTGYVDANGFVHFTPSAGFFGNGAGFDYHIINPAGLKITGHVDVVLDSNNHAPTIDNVTHDKNPIYGWTPLRNAGSYSTGICTTNPFAGHTPLISNQNTSPLFLGGSSPQTIGFLGSNTNDSGFLGGTTSKVYTLNVPVYHPYDTGGPVYANGLGTKWLIRTDPIVHHDTIIGYDDANTGQIIANDVDSPIESLKYQIVGLPQMGGVTIDATGHYQYTSWAKPNVAVNPFHAQNDQIQDDAFQVRVVDPQGASVVQTVHVTHYGTYTPPPPPEGEDGGCPVAVDMDNNGINFIPVADSSVFFDISKDGWKHRVSWTSPGDGWLAYDSDHNGKIERADELAFASYANGAKTDLEGLALAFDTNQDHQFTSADEKWADFGIWVDANGNGVTDEGEFKTLDQLGVSSIDLVSDGQFSVIDGNVVNGFAKVHMADGTTHDAADVTIKFNNDIAVPQADGSVLIAQHTSSSSSNKITGSADADLILAQNGPMEVYAGDGNDFIQGGASDDYIEAGYGDDVIYAGDGNDIISGEVGNDAIFAGNGNDLLIGGQGEDVLFGEAGNDIIYGGDGDDLLSGGDGNDVLSGDNGDDVISGESGNDALFGMDGNDQLSGGSGYDLLYGGAGNDLLDGGTEADTMEGGAGDDIYVVDNAGDVVTENANEGIDTVRSSITYTLGSNLENLTLTGTSNLTAIGNELDNILIGNSADNILDGGIGADTMIGGAGDDIYVVDNAGDVVTENVNEGIDTVQSSINYTLGDNLENLTLTGNEAINGTGNTLNNTLVGNSNDNILDGGTGVDTMVGGAGNDTYIVDNISDVITENANEGTDIVLSSVSYALSSNAENMTLTGTVSINATGNDLNNILIGNNADNLLNGGTGADTMIGGAGNDTYIVDNIGDVVTENANEGIDTVNSSISYTLGANVENLTLTGADIINATGNELNNTLTGNSVDNIIDGGLGTDIMIGGTGNDTYIVDNVGDVVIENVSEGTDSVLSSVTYTLTANVENITLTGMTAIKATGNELNNALVGNSAGNILDGGLGSDTMSGGLGNDTYIVDNIADIVVEDLNAGMDTVLSSVSYTLSPNVENLTLTGTAAINAAGNDLNNMLVGNSNDNVLDGGTGADTLIGGAGNDTYFVDNASDVVTENASEGTDLVQVAVATANGTYALGNNVENATLINAVAYNLTGNSLDNILIGNAAANTLNGGAGNDILDGGAGADAMVGGTGNDTYIVDNISDIVTENLNEGTDLVKVAIAAANGTYTLGNNIENGTLINTVAYNLTGNGLNNTLIGNSADNVLDGGTGADTLIGGAGNDTYVVDNIGDVVTENVSEGTDLVKVAIATANGIYTLGNNVENGTLINMVAYNLAGNALDNFLIGNSAANTLYGGAGNDTLDGGAGADTMLGGTGNDTYIVDNIADVVTENANEGTDTVISSIDYTLGANIENLTLTGSAKFAIGNSLDNYLIGNNEDNILRGGGGNDTLDGGLGADHMYGGAGDNVYYVDNVGDKVVENHNEGIDTVISSVSFSLSPDVENLKLIGANAIDGSGNQSNNWLVGNAANNILSDASGNDILQGMEGQDTINDTSAGNNLLDGGAGGDIISAGKGINLIVGGLGNDTINSTGSYDVIAFNQGDGQDTLNMNSNSHDTISLGGGIDYSNLSLSKSGNDLILKTGGSDQITIKNWYSTSSHGAINMQVIADSMATFNSVGSNTSSTLRDNKVESFNFAGLVGAFDSARASNPGLNNWSMTNALLNFHLADSDTAAIGGDLAYQYGKNGSLAGIGLNAAQSVINDTTFGKSAQMLNNPSVWQAEVAKLS